MVAIVYEHKFSSEVLLMHSLCASALLLARSSARIYIYCIICLFIRTVAMFRYGKHEGNIRHTWIGIVNYNLLHVESKVDVTLPDELMKSSAAVNTHM